MARILDSRSLTLFAAVARSLSFRQAAQELHLSQPPLSRAIRELEERLGTRLFERDTQGVALTEAGQALLPRARRILRLIDEAEAATVARSEPASLKIGFTSAAEARWFAGLPQRIAARRPGTTVVAVSDSSPRLVRALRSHRLHAAFVALPTDTADLNVIALERQPMVLALPSAHRLARKRSVALADLQGERLFMFERTRQPAFFDHWQAVFAHHGFSPKLAREPVDHPALLAGVAGGQALALLPESFTALRRQGVSYRALKEGDELAVGIGLATREDSAALRTLIAKCTLA